MDILQKQDLAAASFANDNTNAAGGLTVRTDAGSTVGDAITAATPDATTAVKGLVELATVAETPTLDTVRAVTPEGFTTTLAAKTAVATTGASRVGFLQQGAGAVGRTLQGRGEDWVSVKDFGAVGDGVTDDTAALVLAAAALEDGQTLDFLGGTYLISYIGTANANVYGNVVMDFASKRNITLKGAGATIKIVNHDIAAKGGLRFINFASCKNIVVEGFTFDMTFTGVNTSALYYPWCGAITALDFDSASPAFSTLNSDFLIENCAFKLFHPYGAYALSGTSYAGDFNNGYKVFSVFASGAHTPTSFDNQNRNLTMQNCTFLKGHNGYGAWAWAWNNCSFLNNTAEDWVSKSSDSTGTFQNSAGISMLRYIPFRTTGVIVSGNKFRAKPSSERILGSGFEGVAQFFIHANNMGNIDWDKGSTIVANNQVILGNGAHTGTHSDTALFFNGFGLLNANNNQIDGHPGESSAGLTGSFAFTLIPGGATYDGDCTIDVSNNTIGTMFLGAAIYFTNGTSTSAAQRRCKSLTISGNTQRSGDVFLRMADYSADTYEGCANTVITNNIIDGTIAGGFPQPSINNYGIWVSANVATDICLIANNTFINKTEAIITKTGYVSASALITRYGNTYYNITTPYNAANLFPIDKIEIAQIKFPSTQVASTDANTLDDYEEGTFTPLLIGTAVAGAGTYTTQVGKYTKIGNRVFISATMTWTAHTGTGNFRVNGLPFTSASIGFSALTAFVYDVALTASNTAIAYIANSSTQITPLQVAAPGALNNIPVDIAGTMVFSGHYDV